MGQSSGFAKRPGGSSLVQLHEAAGAGKIGGGSRVAEVQAAAAQGVAGGGGPLPYGAQIQQAFGRHDVSGISAHVGGPAADAAQAMGAEAYATGSHVAFGGAPSLHTAAHEAAHVVQQRGGVQLKGGVGEAGDPHERHADAVADAVVQGGSAEGLLDEYAGGGGGGGGAVQRQELPPAAKPVSPEAQAAIAKLDGVAALAADVSQPGFDIDAVAAWLATLEAALAAAKAVAAAEQAAGTPASPELAAAVDRCAAARGPELTSAAAAIRDATVAATNSSSVAKAAPAVAPIPTQAQGKALIAAAGKVNALGRDAVLPAGASGKASLAACTSAAQDAGLAVMQSLSVANARERWTKGDSTETPSVADAGKGPRTELDEIFKDVASFGSRVATYVPEGKTEADRRVYDWCGMFVAASMYKGAGLAVQVRSGFHHVDNVHDFFHYVYARKPDRIPQVIWAEGRWWPLKDYHAARGGLRTWTSREAITAAIAGGGAGDIRSGDICLINHKGGAAAQHIVMVESYDPVTKQLVTIEGNTFGIHADADGKAERLDDDHLKDSKNGAGTAAGVHVRELRTLVPGPGAYVVNTGDAAVRQDENLAKPKLEEGKSVLVPKGTEVTVTEVKDHAGVKYAKVDGWGWIRFTNLGVSAKPPAGGYEARQGATVVGVGRPSAVDFEDGHEYAITPVPEALATTSPDEMRELAKYKGTDKEQKKLAASASQVTLK